MTIETALALVVGFVSLILLWSVRQSLLESEAERETREWLEGLDDE